MRALWDSTTYKVKWSYDGTDLLFQVRDNQAFGYGEKYFTILGIDDPKYLQQKAQIPSPPDGEFAVGDKKLFFTYKEQNTNHQYENFIASVDISDPKNPAPLKVASFVYSNSPNIKRLDDDNFLVWDSKSILRVSSALDLRASALNTHDIRDAVQRAQIYVAACEFGLRVFDQQLKEKHVDGAGG